MIGTIVHQLTDGLTPEDFAKAGLDARYVNHGFGIYPMSAGGDAWSALTIQSKGDPVVDLYEDMAADAAHRIEQHKIKCVNPKRTYTPTAYTYITKEC